MPIRSHVGEAAGFGLRRRYDRCLRLPPHPLRYPALGCGVEDGGEVAEWNSMTIIPTEPSSTVRRLCEKSIHIAV
jgi:hypothetical protein